MCWGKWSVGQNCPHFFVLSVHQCIIKLWKLEWGLREWQFTNQRCGQWFRILKQANPLLSTSDVADTQRRNWQRLCDLNFSLLKQLHINSHSFELNLEKDIVVLTWEEWQTEALASPVTDCCLSHIQLIMKAQAGDWDWWYIHAENLSHTEPLAQEIDLRITLTFLQPLFHQYLIMISLCTNRRAAAQHCSLSTCAHSVTHTQQLGALHTTNILPTYRQMLNLSPTQCRFLCGLRESFASNV